MRILLKLKYKKGKMGKERYNTIREELIELMTEIEGSFSLNEIFIKKDDLEIWRLGEKNRFLYHFGKKHEAIRLGGELITTRSVFEYFEERE